MIKQYQNNRLKRHARVRVALIGSADRPRLAVFRSVEHVYAQIIDDSTGKTIASASDLKLKDKMTKTDRAKVVGQNLAAEAKKKKVTKVRFDRGGFAYHGRVKALADAARSGGLEF